MNVWNHLFSSRRPMSCRQVGRVLQTYLDSELDADTARRVAAHLEDCRRCGLEVETYEALKAALRRDLTAIEEQRLVRLRDFGEQLARGELDSGGVPTP